MHFSYFAKAVLGAIQTRKLTFAVGNKPLHGLIENRMEYFFFAPKVEIDRAVRYPGRRGYVGNFRVEITFLCEYLDGCAQDRFSFVRDRGLRYRSCSNASCHL